MDETNLLARPPERPTFVIPWLAGAALLGGLLWAFKGGAILLGDHQPEYAFEVAPLLFALVTLGLARWVPPSRARRVGVVLAVTAVLGCLVAAVSSVVAGGALSAIDERLLEVPIVAIGFAWIAVGLVFLRLTTAPPRGI